MADESKPENILDVVRRLTEQVEQLQAENTRLKKRIEDFERKKNKYVAPHSREQPKVDPKPSGRRAGVGNFSFKVTPAVETITRRVAVAEPNRCSYCDSAQPLISKTLVKAYMTDLVASPQPEITEYSVPVMECPSCGRSVRGSHEALATDHGGASAHRLGARLHAATQVLRYDYGIPERKIPGVLELLTGAKITQSALNQAAQRKAAPGTPLDTRYSELKAEIQQAPYVHQDDTRWRNKGNAAWLGVYCSSNTVLYTIHPKHTHQEVLDVLGEAFQGVLVSDRYTVYDHAKFAQTQQQKCVAHLIRNADETVRLQQGKRGQGILYPQSLAQLFRASLKLYQGFHAQKQSLSQYRLLGGRLEQRLTHLLERKPLKSKDNERLRVGLLKQHRLNRLVYFLKDPGIPPTNNAAERALRPAVIARKVSQCSRSQGGADTFAKFKSVVETAKLRGQIPLEVLTQLNLYPRPG